MLGERLTSRIEQIARYLAKKEIALHVTRRAPLCMSVIEDAETAIRRALPRDLVELYSSFSNGFDLFWRCDPYFARLSLPTLSQFVKNYCEFQAGVCEMLCSPAEYFDESRISDGRAALKRMLNRAVLWHTGGDGNSVCIDLETQEVLFHDREWPFYESFECDFRVSDCLSEMLLDWGRICFLQFPGCPGTDPTPGQSNVPDYSGCPFIID